MQLGIPARGNVAAEVPPVKNAQVADMLGNAAKIG